MNLYEKKYQEALERAKDILCYKEVRKEDIEYLFPELKESDDEKIRRWIIDDIRYNINNEPLNNSEYKKKAEKAIAWLEKQRDRDKLIQELGEYKVKYTQEVLEKYINNMSNKDDERLRKTVIAFLKDFAEQGYENAVECIDWLEKQGEQAPSQTNERAWLYLVSDVLTWKDGIGQYLDDPRVQELAKRLCSKYTQKLYNPSNTGKNEQKSADKIEPRFKVGDWVVNKFGDSWHIDSFDKKNYQVSDGKGNYNYFPISKQDEMHLWTIQNAKDCDVLACNEEILLFKSYSAQGRISLYCWYNGHTNNFHGKEVIDILLTTTNKVCPATKEQRDTLMKAMNDAGYEWDIEKKELKKKRKS